jgi:hypothetical protein
MAMLGSSCSPCCAPAGCGPLRIGGHRIGPGGVTDPPFIRIRQGTSNTFIEPQPGGCDPAGQNSRGLPECRTLAVRFGSYTPGIGGAQLCAYTRVAQETYTDNLATIISRVSPSNIAAECVPTVRTLFAFVEVIQNVAVFANEVIISTSGTRVDFRSDLWQEASPQFTNSQGAFCCPQAEPDFAAWIAQLPSGCPPYGCMDIIPRNLVECNRTWTIPIEDFNNTNFATGTAAAAYLRDLPGEFTAASFNFRALVSLQNLDPDCRDTRVTAVAQFIRPAGKSCSITGGEGGVAIDSFLTGSLVPVIIIE